MTERVPTRLRSNPKATARSRAFLAGALLLAGYQTGSFGRQANGSTDWEVKQLAYDSPHEVLHSGMAISENDPMVLPSTYTDLYLRSGPELRAKRMLDGAKLPRWSPDRRNVAFLAYCR